MDRTIILRVQPNSEQASLLQQALQKRTACFNAVSREEFTASCSKGPEPHKRIYSPLRTQYPNLPAQLVCAARVGPPKP